VAAYSDVEIDALISCPKEICEAPARALKIVDADWRNNAKMQATDGTKGTFSMFMRKNEDLPENFSVGLRYNGNDGRPEITLLRCNGKHGTFTGAGDAIHPHWDFHIHQATEAAQDAGFTAEKYATKTTAFASYEQAVQYFLKIVKLTPRDASRFFPDTTQANLFGSQ
jgi:hypothetical protein